MAITFPNKACAVTYTWKVCLLLERQCKNKKINERHLLWYYSHFWQICWLQWKSLI